MKKDAHDIVGVDAGKYSHRIWIEGRVIEVQNSKGAIKAFLRSLPEGAVVAVESTGRYHSLLADLAHAAGLTVYVLNSRRTAAFKRASGLRGKTDSVDAHYVAMYAEMHQEHLHPYVPYPFRLGRLRWLVKRRVELASRKHDLSMSLRGGGLQSQGELLAAFDKAIAEIDAQVAALAEGDPAYERLLSIKGVGPLVAAGLMPVLVHFDFRSPDSFVAYCGLDPRPCESGTRVGKRRISRFGDACLRRLLFLAAMSAQKCDAWKPYYQASLDRGLGKMHALMRLARRIARLSWYAVKQDMTFDAKNLRHGA